MFAAGYFRSLDVFINGLAATNVTRIDNRTLITQLRLVTVQQYASCVCHSARRRPASPAACFSITPSFVWLQARRSLDLCCSFCFHAIVFWSVCFLICVFVLAQANIGLAPVVLIVLWAAYVPVEAAFGHSQGGACSFVLATELCQRLRCCLHHFAPFGSHSLMLCVCVCPCVGGTLVSLAEV